MCHAIVEGGGEQALGCGRRMGRAGGVFQFVSHGVKTDVDGNMKAKHRRHHTSKCVHL